MNEKIIAAAASSSPIRCSSIFPTFDIVFGMRVSRFDMLGEPGDATRVNLPHKEVSSLGMEGNWPGTAASHER